MFKDGKLDKELVSVVMILSMIGIIMVFSSSSITANRTYGDSTYFLNKSLARLLIGVVAMVLISRIDYHVYKKYALWILIITLIPLAYTMVKRMQGDIGVNGATRWVSLLPGERLRFQPSEFVKVALVVYLAHYLSKKQMFLENFKEGLMPAVIFPAIIIGILVMQPNYGMAVTVIVVSGIMIFISGAKLVHLLALSSLSIPFMVYLMLKSDHAARRIMTFLATKPDIKSAEYNIYQSLISFGNGGINGVGLGGGRQKFFYLPEAHTDFIFSVIGEELGIIGAMIVILLFLWLFWRGMKIALCIDDRFGSYLAFGITTMLFTFAIINMAVVLRIIPATGLPLPFISYGGTSLVVNLASVGVLLNISKHIGASRLVKINIQENDENAIRKGIFISRRRNGRTYNPGLQNCSLSQEKIWSKDHVHRRQKRPGIENSTRLGI
ncbi:MAG: putative lipid II flippase FtsW [Candidatus Zixiibacteriota bacterium]